MSPSQREQLREIYKVKYPNLWELFECLDKKHLWGDFIDGVIQIEAERGNI